MLNQAAMKLNVSRLKYDTSLSMAFNFCSMSNNESLRKNDRNVPLETLQKTRKIPVTNYKNNSKKISFDKSVRLNKELLCIKSIKGKLKDMSEVSFSKIIKNGASKELLDGYNTMLTAWIRHCSNINQENQLFAKKEMIEFFKYLEMSEMFIDKKVALSLMNFYQSEKASITSLYISETNYNKTCANCRGSLNRYKMTQEELRQLSNAVKELILRKHSALFDLDRLKVLVEEDGPFDIVIDGANIHFRRNTRGQCGFFEISRNLFQVNKYFSDLGWKVLLIHKQDFFKTHHHSQINRLKNVKTLILSPSSENADDLFVIFSALSCGDKCKILSNDKFRDHFRTLEKKDGATYNMFMRWLISHQAKVEQFKGYKQPKNAEGITYHCDPEFYWPFEQVLHTHKCEETGCWHIPIQPEKHQYQYYIPYQWVCIQSPISKKKKTTIKEEEVVLERKKKKLKLADYNLLDSI